MNIQIGIDELSNYVQYSISLYKAASDGDCACCSCQYVSTRCSDVCQYTVCVPCVRVTKVSLLYCVRATIIRISSCSRIWILNWIAQRLWTHLVGAATAAAGALPARLPPVHLPATHCVRVGLLDGPRRLLPQHRCVLYVYVCVSHSVFTVHVLH